MSGRPTAYAGAGWLRGSGGGARALPALLLGVLLLLVTACSGGGDGDGAGADGENGGRVKPSPTLSQAVVTVAPKDGAKDVDTSGALKITASKGTLTKVQVADDKGTEVAGDIVEGGAAWRPKLHLAASTTYKVHAVAKDTHGRESAKDTTFTTLVPKNTFIGRFTPEDGATVGVGMPVSLNFSRGITDPKAVERGIEVKAEPAIEIRHKWYGNDRLDFRPEKYWAPGTKVTLTLALDGVEGRPGVYGKQAKTVHFTIGRSQVSYVDASAHTMRVTRGGKTVRNIPITAGAPGSTTYNGQMVISEKYPVTRMNGETVGYGGEYDIPDVPHAMRLSTSGTFVHGNYWAGPGVFGNQNASHGCVGLRDARGGGDSSTPASWFYNSSLIGDVVVVSHSNDKRIQWWNGLNGWNLPWGEWES
ncbi:Ig-like domain-containing protein [Streptomyces sp. NPDC088923]|uniref:L,D-transpeptidase n=1 Tax=Streptomyces sp. NPDC088923 TaxID=3365913 RepID=UPI00382E4146